ncbi:MAG: AAA family ATPase [Candidatus Hodarchaeales archaeon]|jgi:RecA-family ATPase
MMTHEELILGQLLAQPGLLDKVEVPEVLFTTEKLRRTFAAIKQQWEENRDADPMIISEKIGGKNPISYLMELQEGVHLIPTNNFQQHVNLLKKKRLENEFFKESERQRTFSEKGMMTDFTKIGELYSQVQGLEEKTSLEIETLQRLYIRDVPQRKPLIDPILGEKEIIILSGYPKSGKSILSMNIAIRLSQGRDWIGFKVPEPVKILILQQEVSQSLFKDRLSKMIIDKVNSDFLKSISHNIERGILIDTKEGVRKLSREIEDSKPKMIIIDPLIKFHTKKENVAEEMEIVFEALHQLVDSYGVSFLVIHHFAKTTEDRKGGYMQRGSSVISANSDANWQWSFVPRDKYEVTEEDSLRVGELSFEFRNIESIQALILKQSDTLWYERTTVRKKGKLDFHDIRIEIEKAGGRAYQRDIEKKFVPKVCSHRTFVKAVEDGEERAAYDSVTLKEQTGSPKLLFISGGERDKTGN